MGEKTHVRMPSRRAGLLRATTILIAPGGKTDAAVAWATQSLDGGTGLSPIELVQPGRAGEVPGATRLTLAGLKRACQAGLDARGPDAEPAVDRSGGRRC